MEVEDDEEYDEEEEEVGILFDLFSLDKYRRDYEWIEELSDLWTGESLFTQEIPPLVEANADNMVKKSKTVES